MCRLCGFVGHKREMSEAEKDERRLRSLKLRMATMSAKLAELEAAQKEQDARQRITSDLMNSGIMSYKFWEVPSDYYDLTLEERAQLLHAHKSQLCKSILFENTACSHNQVDDPTDSKYYCVVVQYQSKINTTMLKNYIHALRKPTERLSKSSFNLQLAPEDKSLELSGYGHNAICPFGLMERNLPIIICDLCLEAKNSIIYLGGGHKDVKLSLPLSSMLSHRSTVGTGHFSEPRDASNNNSDD